MVGAGPVGSFCAIVHAQKGERVALLEANQKASHRLAGEWLHPPAVKMLNDAGLRVNDTPETCAGKGFVVFPEDGSEPIELPYSSGQLGMACEHSTLVEKLRVAARNQVGVEYIEDARARVIRDGEIQFTQNKTHHSIKVGRVIGADGRASVVRKSLGFPNQQTSNSRMVGFLFEGAQLPRACFGHVVLGAPGPILMYEIGNGLIRVMLDVPLRLWQSQDRLRLLVERYRTHLPEMLREPFGCAVLAKRMVVSPNGIRLRTSYGTRERTLIGDAAGNFHPLTAAGLTIGFGDASALAENEDFQEFANSRMQSTQVADALALGLYEVFADHHPESMAVRQSTYKRWRTSKTVRTRTIHMLACQDTSMARLGSTFASIAARAVLSKTPTPSVKQSHGSSNQALLNRIRWFVKGTRELKREREIETPELRCLAAANGSAHAMSIALRTSMPNNEEFRVLAKNGTANKLDVAIDRATANLLNFQEADGAWEAELIWSPMITAQYVLLHHAIRKEIPSERKERVLTYFRQTQLNDGTWGFHLIAPPHLFVTTLVYVAARLLGCGSEDALVKRARKFIHSEGVTNIPSWGKFWLSVMGLYKWDGLNPIVPELWHLPRSLPVHPSRWHYYARTMYMSMAYLYANRFTCPESETILAIRDELYNGSYESINFSKTRNSLRVDDLYDRPTFSLRVLNKLLVLYERFHLKSLRERSLETVSQSLKAEIECGNSASVSTLPSMKFLLAISLADKQDSLLSSELKGLDRWLWDDDKGLRVVSHRTSTWDTGFAIQALNNVPKTPDVAEAIHNGTRFLLEQQVQAEDSKFKNFVDIDSTGGWCLGRISDQPALSDVAAEAILAIAGGTPERMSSSVAEKAVRYMLGRQNRDGGFGVYERQRSWVLLERLNPSELFADAMTEFSSIECTASCLAALMKCKQLYPEIDTPRVRQAIHRAEVWIRKAQLSDGAWQGNWGINQIYGTLFGVKGLIDSGADPNEPSLKRASSWLIDRQRPDGGWGEHYSGCCTRDYVPHPESQIVQTAWALIALLLTNKPDLPAITNGIKYLVDMQQENGDWPKQDPSGVFSRTVVLDYPLYRRYFPLRALGMYKQRICNPCPLAMADL